MGTRTTTTTTGGGYVHIEIDGIPHRHRARLLDRRILPASGCVAEGLTDSVGRPKCRPQSHGGSLVVDRCSCGAVRRSNQRLVDRSGPRPVAAEYGPWRYEIPAPHPVPGQGVLDLRS